MKTIPIPTLHLFAPLDEKLIALLRSLSDEEWNRPTLAKLWTVKDVAAHLLDGNLRTTSLIRDHYAGDQPDTIGSHSDLVNYLNRLNADWVKAMKRLSPKVLTDLLESSGKEYIDYLSKLDPFEPALFSVGWAGEEVSPNWFHIARDYTEKWHHQKQIREAVGQPGLMEKEFFHPLIDTLLRALPYTYRNTHAAKGTSIEVIIPGEAGGRWTIVKGNEGWQFSSTNEAIHASVHVDADTAWKLFTKGITREEAERRMKFSGDISLGKIILQMISVMG